MCPLWEVSVVLTATTDAHECANWGKISASQDHGGSNRLTEAFEAVAWWLWSGNSMWI